MIDKLKKKFEEEYGKSPSFVDLENFSCKLGYSCRMFWQHRTNKIHTDDIPLYISLTNEFCDIDAADKIPLSYQPKYGSGSMFLGKYPHHQLEAEIITGIINTLSL